MYWTMQEVSKNSKRLKSQNMSSEKNTKQKISWKPLKYGNWPTYFQIIHGTKRKTTREIKVDFEVDDNANTTYQNVGTQPTQHLEGNL